MDLLLTLFISCFCFYNYILKDSNLILLYTIFYILYQLVLMIFNKKVYL